MDKVSTVSKVGKVGKVEQSEQSGKVEQSEQSSQQASQAKQAMQPCKPCKPSQARDNCFNPSCKCMWHCASSLCCEATRKRRTDLALQVGELRERIRAEVIIAAKAASTESHGGINYRTGAA